MKKIVTVVGLGISGAGAAHLLNKKGWEVKITEGADTQEVRERAKGLQKLRGIKIELGKHTKDFIAGSQLVITSPGVKDNAIPLVWARELGIPVIDEIELGYRFCPCRIVAVTGTNGKSTTTTLIGEILKAAGLDAVVCGNIGLSFCEKVAHVKKNSVIILEVSSFQLQRIDKFRPYVSVFLNITQNHLDRHKNFREYLDAKLNIFKNQKRSDWAILNYEDKRLRHVNKHIRPRVLYFGDSPAPEILVEPPGFKAGAPSPLESKHAFILGLKAEDLAGGLKGGHNVRNALAATLVGNIFKIKPEVIKSVLKKFSGLEHRCEYVAEIDGIKFINDSKATTVDAAMWAIRSFDEPVILIAGGRDKGSDFTVLKGLIEEKVRAVVLIGEAKTKIRIQLLGSAPIREAQDLEGAVNLSFNLASEGDAVLLSPMCASFDMFKNFEERGGRFKKAVMALKNKTADLCRIQ